MSGFNSWCGTLSRYVTSHPGQLNLAIPLCVGAKSTSQRAVTPCSWGVKADTVGDWVAGKTVYLTVTDGSYLSALEIGHNKALYKFACFTFLLLMIMTIWVCTRVYIYIYNHVG